jgi:hypothetical protein
MTMPIPRQNKYLNEILDHYDRIFDQAHHSLDEATQALSDDDNAWINSEIARCMRDPRYYLENYHVVRTEQEGLKTLYPFWESQDIFYNEVRSFQLRGEPVRMLVLKARQLGLTTISQGLLVHKTIFSEACNSLDVAQDIQQSSYMFEMSRIAIDSLPWWMRPEIRYETKGNQIVFDRKDDLMRQVKPGLKSNIFVEAANKPTGVARGKSINCLHGSELASWPDGEQLTKSIFPTMNTPDTLAILESTALGRQGFWYKFWKQAINGKASGESRWHPLFIEYFRVKKYSIPITAGKVFHPTKDEEIFRTKIYVEKGVEISDATLNWKRIMMKEFVATEGDDSGFYGEYPATWQEAFQGTGICAFNKRMLQKMLDACEKPKWIGEIIWDKEDNCVLERLKSFEARSGTETLINPEKHGDYRWRIWEKYDDTRDYYVSVDVAMGNVGGDYSCVEVIKIGRGMEPDEQVAEWRGWVHPTKLAYVTFAICHRYGCPEVAVEVNSMGITTNSELMRVLEYDNLYRWKHMDKMKNQLTDLTGWYTTSKSRDNALSKLIEAVSEATIIVNSEWLIDEMLDFAQDESARFEGQNTNDDRVMCFMIGHYCAHESDYGKHAASQPSGPSKLDTKYFVMDQFQRKRAELNSREAAVDMVSDPKHLGWSYTAAPEKKTRQNTVYSPIHDNDGVESRMYEHGYSAEGINHETIRQFADMESTPQDADPDAWLWG